MAVSISPSLVAASIGLYFPRHAIVPCGVADPRYGVTSLADLGRTVSMPEVDMMLRSQFEPLFGATADAHTVPSTENNSSRRRSATSSGPASR